MISAFLENKVSRAAKLREVILPRNNLHSDLDSIILLFISTVLWLLSVGVVSWPMSVLLH